VYIREAHPDSVLTVVKDGEEKLEKLTQTLDLKTRLSYAEACTAALKLSTPTVVDREDNMVNAAYSGWPDRFVIVGEDGRVAYVGARGPGGFKPAEVEQWLEKNTKKK
jgi:hypothetical protein